MYVKDPSVVRRVSGIARSVLLFDLASTVTHSSIGFPAFFFNVQIHYDM